MVTELNRFGITNVFVDLLKADKSILFGPGKLVKEITSDPLKFAQATVSNDKPYVIYMWTEAGASSEERASNAFDEYAVGVKIRG